MISHSLENLSTDDLNLFFQRLAEFYEASEHTSFQLLRGVIARSLPFPYRLDDLLIDEVMARLVRINSDHENRGDRIKNFEYMAKRVSRNVSYEEDRRRQDGPRSLSADDQDTHYFSEPSSSIDRDIERIESEIQHRCYRRCLQDNQEMLKVFDLYYPEAPTSRVELNEIRLRLAEEIIEPAQDPRRKKNTLEVRIYRFKTDLTDRARRCFEQESSKHIELQRLYQQKVTQASN